MDRKNHSFNWPYSYPPFPSAPGWFSVNGGWHPQFPSGSVGGSGIENMGMGVPVWFQSPDLRGMPAMTSPRQQPASQAQGADGGSTSSSSNIKTANPAPSPPSGSPLAAESTNINTAVGALVPSRPSSPMTVDAAMQCLSGQLHDAIRLCADYLKTHAEFVDKAHFTTAETRNGVWKDLLEHKFKSSGFLQDGFNNFGRRLSYYMEQAYSASQNDPALGSGEQERQRGAKERVRDLRLLRAMCDEVVQLSEAASVDVLDCKEMLGWMRDMKKKLDRKAGGEKEGDQEDGDEGGNSDEAQSPGPWSGAA